jgi:predicted lipase
MGTLLLNRNLKFKNTDKQTAMSPLQTTGVVDVGDSYVHSGFLLAYNTVASGILDTINAQVAAYPSYQIVVVGHSLGGAVASIAALSIKAAVPNAPLKLFTYGRLTSSMPELSKLTVVCAPRPT